MTTNCSKEQCSKVVLSTCMRRKCTCKGSPCATAVIGGRTRWAIGATAPPKQPIEMAKPPNVG